MTPSLQNVVVRLSDSVTLIHGDCRSVLPLKCETCFGDGVLVPVGGEESKCPNCDRGTVRIDAIISDPPYGMGLTHGNRAKTAKQKDAHLWGKQWGTIAGDDKPFDPSPWLHAAVTVLWGANHYCAELPSGKKWLCWFKGTPDGMSYSDCELAWTSVDGGGVEMKSILWSGFRRETEVREHYHPTQKPVTLMEWCMERAKVPQGATVLDPYMGSGTTGIACIRTGRKFIGIEIDAGHFETARKRMEAELMQGTFDFVGGAVAPTHNPTGQAADHKNGG